MNISEIAAVLALVSFVFMSGYAIYKYKKQEKECPLKK